ncbi:glycosyltransferase family 4 protein [Ferruginibacter sp.]
MKKKTVVHIIDDFGGGGAEATVVGVLANLPEYNNVVINLYNNNHFKDQLKYDSYYCLNLKNYLYFWKAIFSVRKIIKKHNADIVHSTLYWSTVIARFATPKKIPLISSIQSSISDGLEYKKKWIKVLDQVSYKFRKSVIVGVSNFALNDYFTFLNIKLYKKAVLYNFVDINIFKPKQYKLAEQKFKLVTVGSFKNQKNHIYLLEAFKKLNDNTIELHIFGDGPLRDTFQKIIDDNNLNIKLMGHSKVLNELLPQYDLFVMSAKYEGFALAVLEGMAMSLPMLLSDIPTYNEQCGDTACYFDLENKDDFVKKLTNLKNNRALLVEMSASGYNRVVNNYTLSKHIVELNKIYKDNFPA